MTKDADRLRKLKALAEPNSGATDGERKTARRMIKKLTDGERKAAQRMMKEAAERVVPFSEIAMGKNGWEDPANRAYYLALRHQQDQQQEEFSKKFKKFANKMVRQSAPNHRTSVRVLWEMEYERKGFGNLTECLDEIMLNSPPKSRSQS